MNADLDHERSQRALADHFAGRIRADDEATLRAHLPGCDRCRRRYNRFLALGRVDRRALAAEERIARGLGLRRPPSPRWQALLVPALAAAGIALFLVARSGDVPGSTRSAPASRGAARPAAALWIYRVPAAGPPFLAEGTIAAHDELAFAYANPGGKAHVLVFAVDEHRHVYWYHPAWPEHAPAPVSLPASPGAGPHELPDAVRQSLDGGRLEVYALLSNAPVKVDVVERAAARAGGLEELLRLPDVAIARRTLLVAP